MNCKYTSYKMHSKYLLRLLQLQLPSMTSITYVKSSRHMEIHHLQFSSETYCLDFKKYVVVTSQLSGLSFGIPCLVALITSEGLQRFMKAAHRYIHMDTGICNKC